MMIEDELLGAAAALGSTAIHPRLVAGAEKATALIRDVLKAGGKVLLCGNGGSAAQCQHIAAELTGRFRHESRPALAAISLTTDTSALTAVGNDFGFDEVFARQVEALGKEGDVLVALSTSGKSKNVLKAIEAARREGMSVVGLTGKGGGWMGDGGCHVLLKAPSMDTARVQECHLAILHAVCSSVEDAMFGGDSEDAGR